MDKFYIPLAIVLAGTAISGALFYTQYTPVENETIRIDSNPKAQRNEVTPERALALADPKRSENRFVFGNTDAKITIVEFSDFECPFCASVHPTLKTLVEESDGQVAWEYRHLPLSIHRNAAPAAIAAECVGEIGGNEAFWKFGDYLFANQTTLSGSLYISGASAIGIDEVRFSECLSRSDIADRIAKDSQVATTLGGGGTPFNVIVYEDGTTRAIPGALPYEQFKALVQK